MNENDKLLAIFLAVLTDEDFKNFIEEDFKILYKKIILSYDPEETYEDSECSLFETHNKNVLDELTEELKSYIDLAYNELITCFY